MTDDAMVEKVARAIYGYKADISEWPLPTEEELNDARAAIAATGVEEMREALQRPYLTVFLDGRNEHGSHVLPMPGDNIGDLGEIHDTLDDQSSAIAEDIIQAAEALGYEINHCVVTMWRSTGYGPEDYWEWQSVDPLLSEFLCGSPGEQNAKHEAALGTTREEPK